MTEDRVARCLALSVLPATGSPAERQFAPGRVLLPSGTQDSEL